MRVHLEFAPRAFPRAPLFVQKNGAPLNRTQMHREWRKAADGLGLTDFHLHDLRHSGLTVAAQAGATLRELMDRAGHASARAAMRYRHAAEERGAEERGAVIAAGMNVALGASLDGPYGTQVAREAITD